MSVPDPISASHSDHRHRAARVERGSVIGVGERVNACRDTHVRPLSCCELRSLSDQRDSRSGGRTQQ